MTIKNNSKYLLITEDELSTIWNMLCSSDTMEEIKNRVESRPSIKPLTEAMQEFVDRCDRGEIRSKYTYTKFKEILKSFGDGVNHVRTKN